MSAGLPPKSQTNLAPPGQLPVGVGFVQRSIRCNQSKFVFASPIYRCLLLRSSAVLPAERGFKVAVNSRGYKIFPNFLPENFAEIIQNIMNTGKEGKRGRKKKGLNQSRQKEGKGTKESSSHSHDRWHEIEATADDGIRPLAMHGTYSDDSVLSSHDHEPRRCRCTPRLGIGLG
ncbi:hypothetical protein U9M48_034005 [Paspalum notatum var. saurae]|uniref:Uncharacterized protein n=1 Tax=Paspalum notatum var. saurae TaxID=547442 RepID=A0AAQ3U8H6_PASNO